MANIQSQIKRNRQAIVRRDRNKQVRSQLRTHMKQFRLAVEAGDREVAEGRYRAACRALDKAAQKDAVHRNYAANKKSKMAQQLTDM